MSCKFLVTALGKDTEVGISATSLASDNAGFQSTLTELAFNGETFPMRGNFRRNPHLADVPVVYQATFGISDDASQIAAMKVVFYGAGNNWTSVTFRGVRF